MPDAKQIRGSNAEIAEAGLNPEDAFAELSEANGQRMAMEVESQQQGPGQLLQNVRRQMEQSPGGKGTVAGRDEYVRES